MNVDAAFIARSHVYHLSIAPAVFVVLLSLVPMTAGCDDRPRSPSAPSQPATPAAPTVTAVSPNTGLVGGMTAVTIRGTGFQSGATVGLDGNVAEITAFTSTAITAATPRHAAGTVDVVVTNPDGRAGTLAGGFTYILPEPLAITAISPDTGSTSGGTSVMITGTAFRPGITVTFGGVSARAHVYASTTIYGEAPAHLAGPVDVAVTNPDGESQALAGGYVYASPQSFDFNGSWDGWADAEQHFPLQLVIQDNRLISASCGTSGIVTFSAPPAVNDGEFAYANEGIAITGRIVSPSAARGTINMGPCSVMPWTATKH